MPQAAGLGDRVLERVATRPELPRQGAERHTRGDETQRAQRAAAARAAHRQRKEEQCDEEAAFHLRADRGRREDAGEPEHRALAELDPPPSRSAGEREEDGERDVGDADAVWIWSVGARATASKTSPEDEPFTRSRRRAASANGKAMKRRSELERDHSFGRPAKRSATTSSTGTTTG